jgi:hypothetical protein
MATERSFEWFAKHRHFETHEYSGYTLREVEIDVHLDAGPKTTIIWKLSGATTIVNRRVMSLIQKLAIRMTNMHNIGELRLARTCGKSVHNQVNTL